MDTDVVRRLERAPEAIGDSSLDLDRVVRRAYRRRNVRWASSALAVVAIVVVAAGALLSPQRPPRVLLDGRTDAADSQSTKTVDTAGWRHHTVTMPDGSIVDIYGPPEFKRDGATMFATLDFGSAVLEFTVGGPGFVDSFPPGGSTRLRPPSEMGSGTLTVGGSSVAKSVALWAGRFYTVSTTDDSLRPQQLEALFRRVRIEERDTGVVLHPEPGVTFDNSMPMSMYQPLGDIGGLEVLERMDEVFGTPEGDRQPAAGGDLYAEPDGSLVLVSDTAVARLTPASGTEQVQARAIMSRLAVSWEH